MTDLTMTDTQVEAVDGAIRARRSARQFLSDPIPSDTLKAILGVAVHAPSGHNTQPWKVHVLTGSSLQRARAAMLSAFDSPAGMQQHRPRFDSYPTEWTSPFLDRRRQLGKTMYTALEVPKGDRELMREHARRNYEFFGAPAALLFTLHRLMVPGSVLDLGMLMQSVMLSAQARGIATCPQAALANFHELLAETMPFDEDEILICGMSMGYRDEKAPVNRFPVSRVPLESMAVFHE